MSGLSWLTEGTIGGGRPDEAQILNPSEDCAWDGRLASHNCATTFHTRGWAQALQSTYGYQATYFAFRDHARLGALLPMMESKTLLTPRRGISLHFSDSCAPLGPVEDVRVLVQRAVTTGRQRGWRSVEFRDFPNSLMGNPPSISFKSHTLDLSPEEPKILGSFESSLRRAIRKAEGSELQISIGNAAEDVANYYELHRLTRKRHGLFPQPYRFFQNLQRHVIAPGGGFVALAKNNERFVAGSVFLTAPRHACYKYGASDERYQELRANNLLMWRAIQECKRRGATTLDFGRTSISNEGLRRFKRNFGTREGDLHYLRLDLKSMSADTLLDRSSGRLNAVIRLLPLWAARLAGQILYPHAS